MKKLIKKITVVACVAAITAANVLAAPTPRPIETTGTTEVTATTDSSSRGTQITSSSSGSSKTSMVDESIRNTAEKKSFTHWNAFFWFILSVAVNFIVSCWVGNRFYRLARKSTQTSNEIRALRKDIEEKFASTLSDIEDPSVEIMNRNENYSRADEGISMPEHRTHVEMNDEEREMMRKWDHKRITQRVIAAEDAEMNDDEVEENEEYEVKPARRSYQPTRRSSGIEFEDEEYEDEDEETPVRKTEPAASKKSSFSKATNKAKDFLSNVFPFED